MAVLYVSCVISLVIFLAMPKNKYEWMLQEDNAASVQNQLPTDENSLIRQVIFFTPIVFFVALTLFSSHKLHNKQRFTATLIYCMAILLVALAKVIF